MSSPPRRQVIQRHVQLRGSGHHAARGRQGDARRDAAAAAVVASMQSPTGAMYGMSVNESAVDLSLDDWADSTEQADGERKEPPPSTWFDDLDSAAMPLDAPVASRR